MGSVKTILEGATPGDRKRGRPKKRWIYNLTEWAKLPMTTLIDLTKDRKQYKQLCKRTCELVPQRLLKP